MKEKKMLPSLNARFPIHPHQLQTNPKKNFVHLQTQDIWAGSKTVQLAAQKNAILIELEN